jgi:hypothetical protein
MVGALAISIGRIAERCPRLNQGRVGRIFARLFRLNR